MEDVEMAVADGILSFFGILFLVLYLVICLLLVTAHSAIHTLRTGFWILRIYLEYV